MYIYLLFNTTTIILELQLVWYLVHSKLKTMHFSNDSFYIIFDSISTNST